MIIFTSICANYGHKARALAQSVRQHMPQAQFFVCLTEREVPESLKNEAAFDQVILAKDMWQGDFDRFIFKHAIVEASTAVKGAFFQYLQKRYPQEDALIYLDPDCYVYGDFSELRAALQEKPIVLCPHLLHEGNVDMEISSMAHGVYNLGFLAVNNSPEAKRLIDWWAERLYLYCYDDIPHGIFTDQKWMDLAPCFFDVKIMRHYGYDFAPWGLLGAKVEQRPDGWFVQDMPLRFVHYSGFGAVAEKCMNDWLGEEGQPFRQLYAEYASVHAQCDADHVSQTPWSYNAYFSGEAIAPNVRACYRSQWPWRTSEVNPFEKSNRFFFAQFGLNRRGEPYLAAPRTAVGRKLRTVSQLMRQGGWQSVMNRLREKMGGTQSQRR